MISSRFFHYSSALIALSLFLGTSARASELSCAAVFEPSRAVLHDLARLKSRIEIATANGDSAGADLLYEKYQSVFEEAQALNLRVVHNEARAEQFAESARRTSDAARERTERAERESDQRLRPYSLRTQSSVAYKNADVVLNHDGSKYFALVSESMLKVFDARTHAELETQPLPDLSKTSRLWVSPDEKTFAVLAEKRGRRQIFVFKRGEKRASHEIPGRMASFSPDGNTLAILGQSEITLHDVRSGIPRATALHTGWSGSLFVSDLRFFDQGRSLVAHQQGGNVKLFDLATSKEVASIATRAAAGFALHPDGSRLAVFHQSLPEAQLLIPQTGKAPHEIELSPLDEKLQAMSFSGDASLIIAASSKQLFFWESESGALRAQLSQDIPIQAMRASSEGQTFLTLSPAENNAVRFKIYDRN